MNARRTISVALLLLSVALSQAVAANGYTAEKATRAGQDCFPAGPEAWIHCMHLDKLVNGRRSVPVLVFSVDGSQFLGTELLLHEDVYAGQPCPQDDLELWGPLAGTPYMACHHFLTTHD